MHRLALGAFWHGQRGRLNADGRAGLNAPFGARCFLTQESRPGEPPPIPGLNAPFGARCFLTWPSRATFENMLPVLMHRMALGAF